MLRRMPAFSVVAATILIQSVALSAETIRISPDDDWFETLSGSQLQPGDELVLAEGVYRDARYLKISHRGTKEHPITIRGEKGAVFHRPDSKQNSLNIVGAQHLVLRDFEIKGGGTGIRIYADGPVAAAHITLQNLHIHHTGGVAVTCNHGGNIYRGMVFRDNHIHHTGGHGEGFYLGSNNRKDGSTPGYIIGAIIEGNYIHHLDGRNVSQGDGIELKDGSCGNIVRYNVIHNTNYPGITAYGTDDRDPNIIEHNLIWSTRDSGMQIAAQARIRDNIIARTGANGIRSKPHQSAVPMDLVIENNTILEPGSSAIRISGPHRGVSVIENNRVPERGLRIESTSGITSNANGPNATGAAKFDATRVPAWTPPSNFFLSDLVEIQ